MDIVDSSQFTIGQSAGAYTAPVPETYQAAPADASAVQSSAPASSSDGLQSHLDSALKNSGIKAEIKDGSGGAVIVQLLDAGSGKLIIQLPSQTVLDLVTGMEQQISKESQLAGPMLPSSGTMINQLA